MCKYHRCSSYAINTHGTKQGVIINDDDEKEYWFGRLGDETVYIDFEERFWYKASDLIKEQCYHLMKSKKKIQYSCRRDFFFKNL